MFIGILLIIVGSVFFLKTLGILTQDAWNLVWPLALIAFGLYLLYKNYRLQVWRDRLWRKLE